MCVLWYSCPHVQTYMPMCVSLHSCIHISIYIQHIPTTHTIILCQLSKTAAGILV